MTSSGSGRRPDGRVTRWEGQRERRRRDFVAAALHAIAEHGADVTTEQIAEAAGVARPQIYKHFNDASDLEQAISDQAVKLVNAELAPLWNLQGTPMEMIRSAVGSHIGFLSEYNNLYRYLSMRGGRDTITDVKTAIARHLTQLLEHYMALFGINPRLVETGAFGIVGFVDFSTMRWLENPKDISQSELAEQLSTAVWRVLDGFLRDHGVVLAPDAPLVAAGLTFLPVAENGADPVGDPVGDPAREDG